MKIQPKSLRGDKVLLSNTGPNPDRILILCTGRNLPRVKESPDRTEDDTFVTVPQLFEPLYAADLVLMYCYLSALAFVPHDELVAAVSAIVDDLPIEIQKVQELIDYFD